VIGDFKQETIVMKIVAENRVMRSKLLSAAALAVATSMTAYTPLATAGGHGAAWGFGGLLAGHLLTDMSNQRRQQTQALQSMAYGGQSGGGYGRGAARAAPAATSMTPEQKLQQLDKLAAGGYITPQEYKERRQAILNSL
jgi:hypothetical protein